jgi:integrase
MQRLFNRITEKSGKIAANRFIDRLRAIFNKGIEYGWKGVNPVTGIKKHKSKSRDRYLQKEELPKFFEALQEEENIKLKDYILLSLLTGIRKSNVLSIRWQDISFQNETLYLPDTKNGVPQLVPLVPDALEILKRRAKNKDGSQWIFPSETSASGHLIEPKKVWKRILQNTTLKIWQDDSNLKPFIENVKKSLSVGYSVNQLFNTINEEAKKQGVELPTAVMDVRLHDLRRSLGSWLCHSGASQYIIGKSLNHKSSKSTEVYARLQIDPVREAMNKAVQVMRAG